MTPVGRCPIYFSLSLSLKKASMQGNDKLKHVGNKRKTEDREEMNSGLVTFAVLSRGIAWASLLLFRSFLLSGFLWSGFLWSSFLFALLLRRRLAALNYIS